MSLVSEQAIEMAARDAQQAGRTQTSTTGSTIDLPADAVSHLEHQRGQHHNFDTESVRSVDRDAVLVQAERHRSKELNEHAVRGPRSSCYSDQVDGVWVPKRRASDLPPSL